MPLKSSSSNFNLLIRSICFNLLLWQEAKMLQNACLDIWVYIKIEIAHRTEERKEDTSRTIVTKISSYKQDQRIDIKKCQEIERYGLLYKLRFLKRNCRS